MIELTSVSSSAQDAGVNGVDEMNPPMHWAGWRYFAGSQFGKKKAWLRTAGHNFGDYNPPPSTPAPPPPQTPQTLNSFNYYGDQKLQYLPPGRLLSSPTLHAPSCAFPPSNPEMTPVRGSQPRPESPAQKPYPPFNDFLDFTGVTSDDSKAWEVLSAQGINDFGRLLVRKIYTLANLNSIGIPFVQAADIFKAVPLYNHDLKIRGKGGSPTN